MAVALQSFSAVAPGGRLRRRTVALLLVAIGHALLIVALLRLAPPPGGAGPAGVTAIELIPDPEAREREARTEAAPERQREAVRVERAPPVLPPPPAELPYTLDGVIMLTREDFAAADIGRIAPQPREAADAGAASADAATVGTGPNGERLYAADWYRRPTQAQLAYYLPSSVPRPGWAMIACQTVDDYRVDNCIELGQSHAGAGLAAAIREAAWQFRVLPPRIGGRPLVGAWVRIKIDFTTMAAE
jgi:hypothetical protein